jgi:hypothetical protein
MDDNSNTQPGRLFSDPSSWKDSTFEMRKAGGVELARALANLGLSVPDTYGIAADIFAAMVRAREKAIGRTG